MAERIVKETLENGNIQFKIEDNTIFGIPTPWWITKIIYLDEGIAVSAIFPTLEEAKGNLEHKMPKVVKREIVK